MALSTHGSAGGIKKRHGCSRGAGRGHASGEGSSDGVAGARPARDVAEEVCSRKGAGKAGDWRRPELEQVFSSGGHQADDAGILPRDSEDGPANEPIEIASIIDAWEASRTRMDARHRPEAEASNLGT